MVLEFEYNDVIFKIIGIYYYVNIKIYLVSFRYGQLLFLIVYLLHSK